MPLRQENVINLFLLSAELQQQHQLLIKGKVKACLQQEWMERMERMERIYV